MKLLILLLTTILSLPMAAQNRQFTLDDLIPGGKNFWALYPDRQYYSFKGEQMVELPDPPRAENDSRVCIREHNIYVRQADGEMRQITFDGSADIVYGEAVHRNEFGIEGGLFWSPDGTKLAFYRMDQSMVSKYPQVNITPFAQSQCYEARFDQKQNFEFMPGNENKAKSRCALYEPDAYPMAGETSHKVTVGIYNMEMQTVSYLRCGDPTDRYFTNIAWSPDSKKVYLIEVNRDQNHGSLDEYDAKTGQKINTLFEESNDKYFEPMHPIQFLPWDATRFIYQTRCDGYNHIYLYRLTDDGAKMERQLTSGKFEVINVFGFSKAAKGVVYSSNESHPLNESLYCVNMKGERKMLGNADGVHSHVQISPSGKFIIDSYSSPSSPYTVDLINVATGKAHTRYVAEDKWKREGYAIPEVKVGTIKAADGKTDLYYRLVLPTNFDPSKKYPAVVYVYGGPHAHMIDNAYRYSTRGWDIYMAQKGYVMFTLDNRGSEHRGLEFEQATFRRLGEVELLDQMCGVEYLKSLPYVDSNRLGVHGWSFGGYMTTNMMTSFADEADAACGVFKGESPFKVGVAGGPVIDWRFYEVMYGERYMDTPQTNPEGYNARTLLNKAGNLKGRLKIIYGYNDPTCVPQHTLSFLRACADADTYPDLFTYPGDGHNMLGHDRIHLHEVITRYFEDYLK